MNKFKYISRILFGIHKSLYVNFMVFPFFKALHFPILVSYNTKIKGISKHTIKFNHPNVSFGMVKIGIVDGSDGILENNKCYLGTDGKSTIIFEGDGITAAPGIVLKSINGGVLTIKSGTYFNCHCKVLCKCSITIEKNVLFGWNCSVSDGDGHAVYDENNEIINADIPVFIGEHVWVSAQTTILKGSRIPNGCIVGYGSLVNKNFYNERNIIAGIPAKVVKSNISWKH